MHRPLVHTTHGAVRGVAADGVNHFLGIPYALAPRFEKPAPTSWDEMDARAFGPPSPQTPYPGRLGEILAPVPGIEGEWDGVLRLNVWAPSQPSPPSQPAPPSHPTPPSTSPPTQPTPPSPSSPPTQPSPSSPPTHPTPPTPSPVLFWLHGGALERGSPAQQGNSGAPFARDGVIFVSPTYRLGVEGWASFAPNLGLEDVAAALQWVHAEIGAFGGDPRSITVMGESAGGVLAAALLSRQDTRPLIARAVIMSAPLKVNSSGGATAGVARRAGITPTKEAFMALSSRQMLDARAADVAARGESVITGAPIFEVLLDSTLPVSPHLVLPTLDIPLMIGTTAEEYRLFLSPSELAAIGPLKLYAAAWWLGALRAVHHLWAHFTSYGDVFGHMASDASMRKPADALARSRRGVWVYEFAYAGPLGAAHATELPYVFDALASEDGLAAGGRGAPQGLAESMHSAWVRFVWGEAPWEEYGEGRVVRVFGGGGEGGPWARTERVRRAEVLDALPD